MADIVKTIEIDAALSPDYQNAFKAATDQAAQLGNEIKALSKREDELRKLQALGAAKQQAALSGDSKAAKAAAAAYDKFAQKIGASGKRSEELSAELAGLQSRLAKLKKDKSAFDATAELGRAAAELKRLRAVYDKFGGEAVKRQLDAVTARFKAMGGQISPSVRPLETFRGNIAAMAKEAAMAVPGVGALARVVGDSVPMSVLAGVGAVAGFALALKKAKTAIDEFTDSAISMGDEIAKDSKALGVSTDFYQSMSYAMQRGGVSAQGFTSGLKTLDKQIQAANEGNTQIIKSFEAFGVSAADLRSLNTEEIFLRLADGAKGFDDTAKLARASSRLLGGEGYRLAAALAVGSDELAALREEARRSGNVLSDEFLATAEKGADAMLNAETRVKGLKNQLGAAVAPSRLARIEAFNKLIDDNRELINAAAGVAAGFAKVLNYTVVGAISAVSASLEFLRNSGQAAGAFVYKFTHEYLPEFVDWVGDKWTEAVDKFAQGFAAVGEKVRAVWDEYVSPLVEKIRSFFAYLSEAPGKVIDSISSGFQSGFDSLKSSVNSFVDDLRDVPIVGGWLSDNAPRFDASASSSAPNLAQRMTEPRPLGASRAVTIYNSVDARGASPGVVQDVRRALNAAGEALSDLFSTDDRLTYAGGIL